MRILVADDHVLVRAGLRALVGTLPEVTEVLEAGDGEEAVAAVARCRPDVVLMDITMPRLDGLEATRRIRKEFPATRVVILSMHQNEDFIDSALKAGADGYLVKMAAVEDLGEALRTVTRGQTYISPSARGGAPRPDAVASASLTPRQREVLSLIAEGMSSRQIAERLGITMKTVESHRTQLMHRLGIHDIAGLVRYAIRTGLVPMA